MHFLFGKVTDGDLSVIRSNVNKLAKNQEEISRVVQESLSIINTSRVQISENRQAIYNLITDIAQIDERLNSVTEELSKQIQELEAFISTYLQIDVVVEEIKQVISRVMMYLEHLQLQLNMLSLGRLAPSAITPQNLKALLKQIERELEPPLRLPGDPNKDLWNFYQFLTCTTVLEHNRILVVVPIPLLDFKDEMEVYKIHNLPMPFVQSPSQLGRSMTAKFELESAAIAVDTKRTKFVLLTEEELEVCSNPLVGFCAVKSALYPLNLNQFCVTALFTNDSKAVTKRCQTRVKLNAVLPMVE